MEDYVEEDERVTAAPTRTALLTGRTAFNFELEEGDSDEDGVPGATRCDLWRRWLGLGLESCSGYTVLCSSFGICSWRLGPSLLLVC